MRILIIGKGMLGEAIYESDWIKTHTVDATTISSAPAFDISKRQNVIDFFKANQTEGRYNIIINCAAISNVDECERNPDLAHQINALGVKYIAEQAKATGAALIHISTDYVFEGQTQASCSESAATNPRSIYGLTKLEGEYYALNHCPLSVVVRPTWIFGGRRSDFVNQTISKLKHNEHINIINNQFARPTYAKDLAQAIGLIVNQLISVAINEEKSLNQIYHITNKGLTTRYDMAKEIWNCLGKTGSVEPMSASQIKSWVAIRPKTTDLDCSKYENEFNFDMPDWQDSLREYVQCES
ncbi:MAG: dTDP-4-dehydrorhamnose reductase [Candidatus Omnitrophota bacterium]|jgi:dTDP-4-dehydrorhamnose reductase